MSSAKTAYDNSVNLFKVWSWRCSRFLLVLFRTTTGWFCRDLCAIVCGLVQTLAAASTKQKSSFNTKEMNTKATYCPASPKYTDDLEHKGSPSLMQSSDIAEVNIGVREKAHSTPIVRAFALRSAADTAPHTLVWCSGSLSSHVCFSSEGCSPPPKTRVSQHGKFRCRSSHAPSSPECFFCSFADADAGNAAIAGRRRRPSCPKHLAALGASRRSSAGPRGETPGERLDAGIHKSEHTLETTTEHSSESPMEK